MPVAWIFRLVRIRERTRRKGEHAGFEELLPGLVHHRGRPPGRRWPPGPLSGRAHSVTGPRTLGDLLTSAGVSTDAAPASEARSGPDARTPVTGITARSGDVGEGHLFVAIRGTRTDGHAFLDEAIRRGASAVLVEDPGASPRADVVVLRTDDTRRAFARLAAAWHGHPARGLSLVGITGTVGKTSVLAMLEAILLEAGREVATIGSLGLRIRGGTREESSYTAPDPLMLHGQLARAVEAGCDEVMMEVTSHALVQQRMADLHFELGLLTNLIPLEHQDYHGSFRNYVEAKRLFFDHLPEGAPLVFGADSRPLPRLVRDVRVEPVGCGTSRTAVVRVEPEALEAEGSRMTLNVRRPLPRVGGGEVAPLRLPLELRLLGRPNLVNAGLAATAALCLGADADAVAGALAAFPPPRRRMQIVHRGRFLVLDDTVGHPDSISAVFEVAERLAPDRLHVAFAVRGQRGRRINRQSARALAIWAGRIEPDTLIVTRSQETADELNRVEDAEHEAFCQPLRDEAVPFTEEDRLDLAVQAVLEAAGEGDLVLLLGAQGMDRGQEIAERWLREQGDR